jgi:hypothetical protein
MSVWMLIEIGFKLVASIAVLDRIPKSQVQGVSGGIRRGGIPSVSVRWRQVVFWLARQRAIRVLFEIRFELGKVAVLDAFPQRDL